MKRISFNSSKVRNEFFDEVFATSKFKTWTELYNCFNVKKSVFEKYRNGYLTIPEQLFNSILIKFSLMRGNYFLLHINKLDECWGRVKAGRVTYIKHREIFEKGRLLAIKNRNSFSKYNIKSDMPLNNKLAYFIGLFIAEGFTNVYNRHYQTQFTGHLQQEYIFYDKTIRNLVSTLFLIKPYIRRDLASNAVRFNLFSKDLFHLITDRFKIKAGRKSSTVLIPDEILNADKEILFSCISGIYDGEACFFVDKRGNYKKPYPRIDLHMVNPALIKQIYEILLENGIKCSVSGNYVRIYMYGDENIKTFLDKIGFQNPKHIHKISSYFGYSYEPKRLI